EVNASVTVQGCAVLVVAGGPALQDWDEWQVGGDGSQVEVVVHGQDLMLGERPAGALQHEWLAHPVLWGSPVQVPDLVGVPAHGSGVRLWGDGPAAVLGELGEAAGVERPWCGSAGQGAALAEPHVGDEQREPGAFQP